MAAGSKLVVRVVNARNLMAKDGQGSSSAFVQVVFDGQRKATRSIMRDLNPTWDETLEFPVADFDDMNNEILEINVFNNSRRPAGKKGKFLGRVCLHGSTFVKKGQEQLNYYKLDKRGLFSLVRGELGLMIYYTDEHDGSKASNEGTDVSHATREPAIMERGASSGLRLASHADREALHQERGVNAQQVAARATKSTQNEGGGSSSAHRVTTNGERGAWHEERVAHKSTGLKRKMGSKAENERPIASEHATKPPTKTAHASQTRPSLPLVAAQPGEQPLNVTASSGPPPIRRPPTVRFNVPTSDLPATAAESSRQPPSPHSVTTKLDEQNIATQENSTSCETSRVSLSPKLELKPAETEIFLSSPIPQPNVTLPNTMEPQEPAADIQPETWPTSTYTSLNELETPLTQAESHLETSTLPSQPDILAATGDTTDAQPSIEVFEKATKEEEMHFDMDLKVQTSVEGLLSMKIPLNEAVQRSTVEDDYAPENSAQALDDEQAHSSDLVEKMHYLFVRVVKARSLIAKDVMVIPHPYTQVTLGNQHGKTKVIPNTLYPEWNQVFAFGSHIHAGTLEVSLWDQNSPPSQDTFLGAVFFDLSEIPKRMPPESFLAPQWYRLEPKHGEIGTVSGDIMLSVWIGTQSDEAFPDAWQSDTGGYNASMRSKIYLSPKLWYLRLNVIEAQDLQTPDTPRRLPEVSVQVQLGFQTTRTRVAKRRSVSPFWNEDLMLVASEPLEDLVLISVEDHQGPDKYEVIGTVQIPLEQVEKRIDDRQVATRWFILQHEWGSSTDEASKFQGRIHLRICLEGGYHVMDEAAHLSSDMRPSAKQLWNAPIGVLELGILGAQNLQPMKNKDGHGTTDAYCVAKYGPKWVRTRTILDSLSPRWNEQYTWEVYDPCTVLTLCVFDNGDLEHTQHQQRNTIVHSRIGKIRVRLSTLEAERAYTMSYPLLVLQPVAGLKKVGDMEVVIRFSCVSMFSLIHTYKQPLLPRMHYLHPLSMQQQEVLRTTAMKLVALRLSWCEPPLKPEVVQYMLDAESARWSMRRSKANWFRISNMLGGFYAIMRWMKDIQQWRNPVTTLLVHVLFIILLCYPELILPTIFFYMFLIGIWQLRSRTRSPPHIDPRLSQPDVIDHDDLDEEFDTQPTSKPAHIVKLRYERLRSIAGRIQMFLGDVATQGERMHGLLTWRDPRATAIFVIFCFFTAVWLYIAPFKLATFLVGIHFLRHPRFRDPLPSTLLNFFQRLPAQSDRIL
ncbi:hypothetical protein GOP47_0001469 [Adiantum capillus-veneris]|nr:hypothetical protein GOP47_0001469 [Adiantum capillus-veneris]